MTTTNLSHQGLTMKNHPHPCRIACMSSFIRITCVSIFLIYHSKAFVISPVSLSRQEISASFHDWHPASSRRRLALLPAKSDKDSESIEEISSYMVAPTNIWERTALSFYNLEENPSQVTDYVQTVSLLRVGVPSLMLAYGSKLAYPVIAMALATGIDDSGVFAVVAQDASQYIQNILTTSGLVFSILIGQTFYFMYQQQEAIFLSLFEEVTMAKSLLEQVALVSQGRESLYQRILLCVDRYVKEDLCRFDAYVDPALMIAARPVDDPLEDILYLTSVGEPSTVYQTVRSLRQARAYRLGALQRKLPDIHMTLLWILAAIVLFTFPLLGAGSQTIGGFGILTVQSWYLSFIVFGIALTMGVIYELQRPGETGAYNAMTVLSVMVAGLEEELALRLSGELGHMEGPSVDGNGSFDQAFIENTRSS